MIALTRRQFTALALASASQAKHLFAARNVAPASLDQTIRDGMTRHKIPCVVAMVATPEKVIYSGAFGKRDAKSGIDVKLDSLFVIASMTKAITVTAAMQLVEQGMVKLHESVSKYLPQLAKLDVLTGFDASGQPILK